MKKALSFEKDLDFETRLGEVITISLEDDLKFVNSSSVEGNFYISGKYKMYDASTLDEDFNYSVPITIELLENFDKDSALINVLNFTYEIIDNSILRCHIDVEIDGEEIKEERECDSDIVPDELKELPIKERSEEIEIQEQEEEKKEEKEEKKENKIKVNSLFANLGEENDTFTTYSVYIMREEDSIEKVMDKYKVTKEELQNYNDLSKIELNSKIIIPNSIEENDK